MKTPSRILSEWLRRLGVQPATQGLEYEQIVRPVEIVADASHLTSPIYPAIGMAGATVRDEAVPFDWAFELSTRRPTMLRRFCITTYSLGPQNPFEIGVTVDPAGPFSDAPLATIHGVNLAPQNIVRAGMRTTADRTIDTDPCFLGQGSVAANQAIGLIECVLEPLFIPPGLTFYAENKPVTYGGDWGFFALWSEFPVD